MLEFKVQPFCLGKGLILLLILVFSLTLSACSDAPVKIGFSGTLKGKNIPIWVCRDVTGHCWQ